MPLFQRVTGQADVLVRVLCQMSWNDHLAHQPTLAFNRIDDAISSEFFTLVFRHIHSHSANLGRIRFYLIFEQWGLTLKWLPQPVNQVPSCFL